MSKQLQQPSRSIKLTSMAITALMTLAVFNPLTVGAIDVDEGREAIKITPAAEEQQVSEHMSVLLLGIDTGDEGRIDRGRSDVLMLLDINRTEQSGVLASIPRDAYVEIPGRGKDKINHAYAFGGADLAMQTVNQWLDTDIEHYVSVNMAGLKDIISAVGTITVTPPATFSIGEYTFYEGIPTELDGDMALAYARERYTSGGDYGRQERQRDIVEAVMAETSSIDSLMNFLAIFSTLSDNIDTNLGLPDLFKVFVEFRQASDQLYLYQLSGNGLNIDGIYYEEIDSSTVEQLKDFLNS